MVSFSADWRFLEPKDGQTDFDDLDKYVDWCTMNRVRPEFHFVMGNQPAWVRDKTASALTPILIRHAQELAGRYGKKISDWQVMSEDITASQAKAVFDELRKQMPDARLGIEDDARFGTAKVGGLAQDDLYRGLQRLRELKKAGVTVDYFAIEASRPSGLWASAKQMYEVLDSFAKEGVRIHITDFGIADGDRVEGPKLKKDKWDEELRANYYERFFQHLLQSSECGLHQHHGPGAGDVAAGERLLDAKDQPTAAYTKLKELITERWRTKVADKTMADGSLNFRGFHGNYEVADTAGGRPRRRRSMSRRISRTSSALCWIRRRER